jgi:hypothetical protein
LIVSGFDPSTDHGIQYFAVKETKSCGTDDYGAYGIDDAIPASGSYERLRPIEWADTFLQSSDYKSQFSLQSLQLMRQLVAQCDVALERDITCAYFHVPLRRKFVMKCTDGRFLVFTRMLFGLDSAAEVQQIISETLAGLPSRCSPCHAFKLSAHIIVHIDNTAVGAKGPDAMSVLAKWNDFYEQRARAANVSLAPMSKPPAPHLIVFAGVVGDLKSKTIMLHHKMISKLQRDLAKLKIDRDDHVHITARDVASMHGRLMYCAAVTGINIVSQKSVFFTKYVKRLCKFMNTGKLSEYTDLRLPQSVWKAAQYLLRLIGANLPRSVLEIHSSWRVSHGQVSDAVVYVDATPQGWGAVLARVGYLPRAIGGMFDTPLPISFAESVAVAIAAETFRNDLDGLHVTFFIDNTSALAAVRSTAKDESLKLAARAAWQAIPAATVEAIYVKSLCNAADPHSRRFTKDSFPTERTTHASVR